MRKKTPIGTRVVFKTDVFDMSEDTGERFKVVSAGETGTVIEVLEDGVSDWPTVEMDTPSQDGKRTVVADMENPDEVEVIA